jgi:RNA polymerase sigma-70 factor (ECF subfamily)
LSLEAVKVAIHRLRKRFRDAVKAKIAQTVSNDGDVREELDALMQALRSA